MSEMTDEDRAMAEVVVRVLTSQAPRLELERTWQGTPCVRLYEHGLTKGGNDKWTKVGPLLFAKEDSTSHAEVLRHIAGIIEQAEAANAPSLSEALAEARADERY